MKKAFTLPLTAALVIGSVTIAAAQTPAPKPRGAYAERYYAPTGYTQLQPQSSQLPAAGSIRSRSGAPTLPDVYGNFGVPSSGGSPGGFGGP